MCCRSKLVVCHYGVLVVVPVLRVGPTGSGPPVGLSRSRIGVRIAVAVSSLGKERRVWLVVVPAGGALLAHQWLGNPSAATAAPGGP